MWRVCIFKLLTTALMLFLTELNYSLIFIIQVTYCKSAVIMSETGKNKKCVWPVLIASSDMFLL